MLFTFRRSFALATMACAAISVGSVADAKTFRWANAGCNVDELTRHRICL